MKTFRFIDQKPLMISILLLMAMVSFDAPAWVVVFSWFLALFKIFAEFKNFPILSRRLTTILAFLLMGQIYFEFRTFFGQEPSATLLLGLTALKIMDYQTQRDHKYVVILGFMLLAMKPLFSLDLYWVPFLLTSFIGLWWAMLSPYQSNPFKFLSRIFLVSIPVALILFVVFPRVVFPWANRTSSNRAQFGFSEQLNPGRTAALVETDTLVFRARFDGTNLPSMESLYWRGGILKQSYGLNWSISKLDRSSDDSVKSQTTKEDSVTYDIFLEPGNQNYLFALETPLSVKGEGLFIRDFVGGVYRLNYATTKTVLYSGVSDYEQLDTTAPTSEELQIPVLSEKVEKWVAGLKSSGKNDPDNLLKMLRDYYTNSKFTYTISPGVYGSNDLEEFLFDRKSGFCEHFAGSYATIARALGVPARVVIGFHGGEFNAFGDFWRVSTKDAHAWVEVFVSGSWKRVDPTAFAAPTRITRGAAKYFQDYNFNKNIFTSLSLSFNELTSWFQNLNYTWMTFLIKFDRKGQKDFFSWLQINFGWVIFVFSLLIILVSVLARTLRLKSREFNPYQQLLHEIFSWAHGKGIEKEPSQSPRSFLESLIVKYPNIKDFADMFLESYEKQFYQNEEVRFQKILRKKWKEFKKAPGA